jgi:hypothetical protein
MSRDAFDLFEGLGSLSSKGFSWYDGLSPEGKKAAAPLVIMRWLSGTSDPAQIVAINTFANPYIFSLGQEKGLLFKLLAASTTGRNKRYQWIKNPSGKSDSTALRCVKEFYGVSTREAKLFEIDADTLEQMAEELGWDKPDIAKLKKELT